jgi:outer membrane protein assembly factor BamD
MKLQTLLILCVLVLVFLIAGCGKDSLRANLPVEERMKYALELFDKGDFLDAKNQFKIITLSHSGNVNADKAQFYLGECHYNVKEYILSANEYERMIKIYPNSKFVDDAKFKIGLSYYKLSPKYSLDQEYTLLSIKEFQEFLEDYPASDLFSDVEAKLGESRDKLAKKLYSAADQYRRIGLYSAGVIYFTMVLERYYDSQYAANSQFYLGECYRKLKKSEEAIEAFQTFIAKYPKHELAGKAENRVMEIQEESS